MISRKAYVLIRTKIGSAEEVAKALRGRPGVVAADIVTGPHEVITVIQGADPDAIAKVVLSEMHNIKGITDTTTYIVIDSGK